jgi:hypothetical protein
VSDEPHIERNFSRQIVAVLKARSAFRTAVRTTSELLTLEGRKVSSEPMLSEESKAEISDEPTSNLITITRFESV